MIILFFAPLDLERYSDEEYLSNYLNIYSRSSCKKRIIEKAVAQNILLRYLNQFMKLNCDSMPLMIKNEFGKPYFKDKLLPYFNISHTKDLIVVGVSDYEIGVDLEIINSRRHIDEISNRFFNHSENEYINKSRELSHERFFLLWVLREAISKYIGKGFVSFDKDFKLYPIERKVILGSSDITERICAGDVSYKGNNYKISVVSRNTDSIDYFWFDGLSIIELSDKDLIKINLNKLFF